MSGCECKDPDEPVNLLGCKEISCVRASTLCVPYETCSTFIPPECFVSAIGGPVIGEYEAIIGGVQADPGACGFQPLDGNDPFYSMVGLLMHFDGTPGSGTLIDEKGHTVVVANGSPVLSSNGPKFGPTSVLGTSFDSFTVTDPAFFNLGTGDFTIEFWSKAGAAVGFAAGIFTQLTFRDGGGSALFQMEVPDDVTFGPSFSGTVVYRCGPGFFPIGTNVTITRGDWNHIAYVRSAGVIQIYFNGVNITGSPGTNVDLSLAESIKVNINIASPGQRERFMDDLRITKGVARYTANFTPPSDPFPNY